MHNLRVVSLRAANLLRLSAVEFAWENDKPVLTLGGKNGAGKSSVLHTVAMALGGMSLCPDEPLKRGEQRGFVELNLGTLIVRREFWRDLLLEQPAAPAPPAYGETKSRLVVKNPEGVKQEPAQRLLDTLIGKMTFDPTAFAFEDEKTQAKILRQIVNLDVSMFEEQHEIAYDRRAVYTKTAKDSLVILDKMTKYDGVPDAEVSLEIVTNELKRADELRKQADEADTDVRNFESDHRAAVVRQSDLERMKRELDDQMKALQSRIVAANDHIAVNNDAVVLVLKKIDAAKITANAARAVVPDVATLHTKIAEVEDTNSKVRANIARANVMATVVEAQRNEAEQNRLVTKAIDDKAAALRAVKFPVEGLAIAHDGTVTFNGIAFKQASTAEQIRVSVAIGFALNADLKLLCIRNGNALDDDSLALVAAAAEAAGGQVLMEYVTKDANDVSVFIEDGHTL